MDAFGWTCQYLSAFSISHIRPPVDLGNRDFHMPDESVLTWSSVSLTIVPLVIGYAMKSMTDVFEHKRTTRREREAREAARRAQQLERRTTFQRETLLSLQEA